MLTEPNKTWLTENYPGLVLGSVAISGQIQFCATYNEQLGQFLIIRKDTIDNVGGIRLDGNFQVRMCERTDTPFSRLPALHVHGVDRTLDRHFNQSDQSACLCSPLEEDDYLKSELDLRRYVEELVIPFLYGQKFYDVHGSWPWLEYSHGPIGLLESYFKIADSSKARECWDRLARHPETHATMRAALKKGTIKGHVICFCARRDNIRRCHPIALRGIRLLIADLHSQNTAES